MAFKKVEKNQIIECAFHILRRNGIEALNARSIAENLNCSTKPIYFQFKNMSEIKEELKALAENVYIECAHRTRNQYKSEYLGHGMAYIHFAREEKHLFRYLYLNGREQNRKLQIDDATYEDIIIALKNRYNLSDSDARAFHLDMAIYSYGLAVLINTDFCDFTEEEAEKRLSLQAKALYSIYVKEGE